MNAKQLILFPIRELELTWCIIQHNFRATILPGSLYYIAALYSIQRQINLESIIGVILFFFFFVYNFDTLNQIIGVQEDYINKPTRPIPSGKISIEGMQWRFVAGLILGGIQSWSCNVFEYYLLWNIVCVINTIYLHQYWWWKNSGFLTLGTIVMVGASSTLAGYCPTGNLWWISRFALVWGTLGTLQDMRDVAGDRVAGRTTLPILIGTQNCCGLLVLSFLFGGPLSMKWLFESSGLGDEARFIVEVVPSLFLVGVGIQLAVREKSARVFDEIYGHFLLVFLLSGVVFLGHFSSFNQISIQP